MVQADEALEDDTEENSTPLRWRGTSFTWNQAATTTLVGVGNDNIGGEDEFYGWSFTLRPNFYLIDLPKDKLTISAEIGWDTELTDGSTVQRNETLFQDLTVGTRYTRVLWESGGRNKGEYKTTAALGGRLRFPTSRYSINQGKYLTTYLGPSINQQIKLLGQKAKGLNNLTVAVGATWGHLFSRSYTPTNEDLNRTRQTATGETFLSDQLAATSFALNTLTTTVSLAIPLIRGLQLSTAFGHLANFKHDFDAGGDDGDCDVVVANAGCVEAERDPNRTLFQPSTSFDVNLSYPIYNVVDIALGYQNISRWIGEDGQRRNILYSPNAQFYLDITANLDAIYTKVTKRSKRPVAPPRQQTASR